MIKALHGVFALIFFCAAAKAQYQNSSTEALVIPDVQRLPLRQEISLDNKPLISVGLWSKEGKCYLQIYPSSTPIDLDMKAPCDVMTKGAAHSFVPSVLQNKKTDGLLEISFEVVGDLKHYLSMRGECSKKYKVVNVKWAKGNGQPSANLSAELDASNNKNGIKCPRAYSEMK